ncbi:MAG: hypothetical protein ACKOS8_17425 [Gemmataceae bacterium]
MDAETMTEDTDLPGDCLQARLHRDETRPADDRHLLNCPDCAGWFATTGAIERSLRLLPPGGAPDRALRVLARAENLNLDWPFRIDTRAGLAAEAASSGVSRRAKGRSQAARKISVAAGILAALMLLSVGMWLGRHQALVQRDRAPVLDGSARLAAYLELSRSCSDEVEKLVRAGPAVPTLAGKLAESPAIAMDTNNRPDPVNGELDRLAVALKLLAPKLLNAASALPEPARKDSLASLAADWQRQESLYLRLASDHADRRPKLEELAAIARGAREEALREHALV